MSELAEPLIPKDLGQSEEEAAASKAKANAKPTEPPCAPCDLHFVRCLKPNEKKKPHIFAHAMTLQ
jgi:myosin heavy subunit